MTKVCVLQRITQSSDAFRPFCPSQKLEGLSWSIVLALHVLIPHVSPPHFPFLPVKSCVFSINTTS